MPNPGAYWLDLSILPLSNASGQVTHFVAIERDVTEQMEREQTLQMLSTTDPLTGLLNRRDFEDQALKEYSRFERQGEKYALLMLDVDHFKAINDRYGHTTGDRVLQSLAENCVTNLREHDRVARWGGEEFCVLLPCTGIKTAVAIAEKLRRQIAATELIVGDAVVAATTSIGVAEVLASDINHTEVLERADRALYDAKQTGRDRVCVA
jgi:diguanylate cyclase (GGDEF)-like protein